VTQTINGTAGNDILTGTDPGNPANPDGIDFINGGDGNDTLSGLGGNDTISGGLGADILNGGAGFDTLSFANATAGVWVNINGAAFGGEAVGDTMTGFEAMIGSAFNDIMGGDAGNNTISGGAGTDIISISGGTDVLDGGANGDFLDCRTASAAVIINVATGIGGGGAAGTTFSSFENIIATNFNDILTAAATGSTLGGLGGNDTINGGDGNDVLLGDDFLNVIGTTGNDTLSGGAGDDFLQGGALGDVLNGGTGSDTVSYENSDAGVIVNVGTGIASGGHAQGDTLISIENVIGSQFDDLFVASAAVNRFDGRAGGDGVTYAGSDAAVLVNLNGGVGHGGWAEGDTFANNMEYVTGSNFDDTIYGNALANILDGGAGNDVLEGLVGADTLQGGNGSDTASYSFSAAAVTADLKAGFYAGGDAQGDVLQSIENLTGSAFADTLRGDDGANVIDGGGGNDNIASYGGADTINGGAGIDTVYYDGAAVSINLATGQGFGGDAAGDTFQSVENVVGTAANDVIVASLAANSLNGGGGIDTVSYSASAGGVAANLTTGLGSFSDATGDTYVGIENLVGSNFADTLTGNGGNNALSGAGGNDVFNGFGGADAFDGGAGIDIVYFDASPGAVQVNLATGTGTGSDAQGDTFTGIENVYGSNFNDLLVGDAGANALSGADGDDTIQSGAGDDAVSGGNGNDLINAYAGADTIDGGAGIDTVYYDSSAVGVRIDLALHTASGGDAQGDTLTGIENLVGSALDDILIGDAGANALNGGAGNDQFNGHEGADSFAGGAGIDTVFFNTSTAGINANLTTGIGLGGDAAGDTYSGIENLVGSAFADAMNGDAGANTLDGGAGDDVLAGRAGADILQGGAGIDTATYGSSAAGVQIDLTLHTASGGDAQGDTLTGIENVTGSAFNDTLIGDAGANDLRGDVGDDVIRGGAGADRIGGAAGVDTADYSTSSAGVTVDLVAGTGTGGDAQGDTLFFIENVTGSAFVDKLFGDGGANALNGGAGGDVLRGGAGGDVLTGGDGLDQANYQGSAAAVSVNLLTGATSGGDAQGDTLSGIENLYGSSHDDQLTGDNARNVIGGELGNDTLVGNGGDDSLSGEGGDDNLSGGDGADRLIGGDGIDTIHGGTGNDSVDAGTGNDQVFGEAGHDSIYGGAGDDTIDGGDGNDTIEGDGGADAIIGGAGIDTAVYASSAAAVSVNLATGAMSGGDAAGDTLTGIEQVMGSAFADTLTGDANANTLWGLGGGDVLTGGGGGDALKGGAGNDSFVYTALSDSAVSGIGKDGITDFSAGDKIDLSGIDADGNAENGDTAFTFGTGDFTRHAGELRVVTAGAIQVVYVDVNGDKVPDFAINVTSDHPLTASDFVL
jgi:Ca2+-binding RTX toxin-like protein